MTWLRNGLLAGALVFASGCDRVSLSPPPAQSEQPAVAESPPPDFSHVTGMSYAEFVAQPGMDRYRLSSLGLSAADVARFDAGMAITEPAFVAQGGGAEAIVFTGCAISGCSHARSVLAIDARTGSVFVGVSGAGAAEELIPNERVEALLRVTSATNRWDDPARAQIATLQP